MGQEITILGGGPAELALSHYAREAGIGYKLFEANNRVGGNAITFRSGDFSYDSGAHRFHDKDSEITSDILNLMQNRIQKINALSQIYSNGKFIDFPLSPFNLASRMGFIEVLRAFISFVHGRLFQNTKDGSFESMSRSKYGAYLADRFLLNYSKKLWGIDPNQLSPKAAGNRLKGLDLKTFLLEAIGGSKTKTTHLDGVFYYPTNGYGNRWMHWRVTTSGKA
ncbi:MAG: NAD(P)-binding protein [Verrucomicrobia bacterium]|nr:NAD(P)-binding protein [Verrucomicrobiota bacterium]MDA1068898.1 NAD(P)-binding protein [Verrucomicrobiota bacterium]